MANKKRKMYQSRGPIGNAKRRMLDKLEAQHWPADMEAINKELEPPVANDLGDAMEIAECMMRRRNELSFDPWKDITRVYSGAEADQEILRRCILNDVNVDRLLVPMQCTQCEGDGYTASDEKCPHCDDDGRLIRRPKAIGPTDWLNLPDHS